MSTPTARGSLSKIRGQQTPKFRSSCLRPPQQPVALLARHVVSKHPKFRSPCLRVCVCARAAICSYPQVVPWLTPFTLHTMRRQTTEQKTCYYRSKGTHSSEALLQLAFNSMRTHMGQGRITSHLRVQSHLASCACQGHANLLQLRSGNMLAARCLHHTSLTTTSAWNVQARGNFSAWVLQAQIGPKLVRAVDVAFDNPSDVVFLALVRVVEAVELCQLRRQ